MIQDDRALLSGSVRSGERRVPASGRGVRLFVAQVGASGKREKLFRSVVYYVLDVRVAFIKCYPFAAFCAGVRIAWWRRVVTEVASH